MSAPARPIKLSFRIRRNFVSRDWTSIGLRRAHVNRKAGTRTTLGSPGSGLSYAHSEQSRSIGLREPARDSSLNSRVRPGRDWRGMIWIALVVLAIAAVASQALK